MYIIYIHRFLPVLYFIEASVKVISYYLLLSLALQPSAGYGLLIHEVS
jgi:hypothetical protein